MRPTASLWAVPFLAGALAVAAAQTANTGVGGWLADATTATIPATPVAGRLDGHAFHVDKVFVKPYWEESGTVGEPPSKVDRVDGVMLQLQEGDSVLPPRDITIFAMAKPGEQVDGKTFIVPAGGLFKQQQKIMDRNGEGWFYPIAGIQLHADRPGTKPRTDLFPRCTLRLAFGRRHGLELPGSLYLTVNDPEKSWVAGTFTAKIEPR